jgi:hypothetical protein
VLAAGIGTAILRIRASADDGATLGSAPRRAPGQFT